jgi:diguanylate cyclase (GGDEF)-like protein
VALLCIDIDDLRGINDEFGHAAGDSVLCAVAERLQRNSSPGGTPARIGSDQFILAEPATSDAAAEALARQVVGQGTQIVEVGGLSVPYDFRVGIAVGDGPQAGADRLVRNDQCELGQGYLISRPLDAEAVPQLSLPAQRAGAAGSSVLLETSG